MALFLSTYYNKVDKKCRVSVPSMFRNILAQQAMDGIIVYHSFSNHCIEACSLLRLEKINASIESLDPFSEERDAFATSILAASTQLSFDVDGRITLPKELLASANIVENAVFVGKGEVFEIWSPDLFNKHLERSRTIAMEKRAILRSTKI